MEQSTHGMPYTAQTAITTNTTDKKPMFRSALAATALALGSLAIPAMAEIVPAKCTLFKYQPTTTKESFDCSFRQSGGNVTVDSKDWAFTFLAKDQGTGYIRINSIPLTFTKTGQYSLQVMQ